MNGLGRFIKKGFLFWLFTSGVFEKEKKSLKRKLKWHEILK
jgi:hypothetical protein